MSTSYYQWRKPITSIQIEETGIDRKLSIFVNYKLAGTLELAEDEVSDMLLMFMQDKAAANTYWGGTLQGCRVAIFDDSMVLETKLVNEYANEILTVASLLEKEGEGKYDYL